MGGEQEDEASDPLKKQFRILEQDWTSYKKSIPRPRRCRSSADRAIVGYGHDNNQTLCIGLPENSPKRPLSSLQQCGSHSSSTDRRRPAAARAGKIFKGRSLLDALESVKDDVDDDDDDDSPICSTCSSVLIQERAPGPHSCSCSCLRQEEAEEREGSGVERGVVRMIRAFVAIWVVVMGIGLVMMLGFDAHEEHGDCLTPT